MATGIGIKASNIGNPGRLIVIQGGQYGSEAKGLITAKVVNQHQADICVRTGTVNAGHTVYYNGIPHKMQQLPVGWVRPDTLLVLGAGAYIHPDILLREIELIHDATGEDVRRRLVIDYRAGIHLSYHTDRSTASGRHHAMGATGKGCSEAVIDKIRGRGDEASLGHFLQLAKSTDRFGTLNFADTCGLLNHAYDRGETIVIEGTQGTLLDLHLGPYPYVTHKQTQAANWLAECGLSATLSIELILVMRTFPIRVAGNSGPLPNEISWVRFAREHNKRMDFPDIDEVALIEWENAVADSGRKFKVSTRDPGTWTQEYRALHQEAASEIHARAWEVVSDHAKRVLGRIFERTTVTNKLRRIAALDPIDTRNSIMMNRPSSVVITFMNYLFPKMYGATRVTFGEHPQEAREQVYAYVRKFEEEYGVKVSMIGFGPLEEHTFALYEEESGTGHAN